MAIAQGQGAGLSDRNLGDTGGVEAVTLLESEIPFHSHPVAASTSNGDQAEPTNNLLASQTANTYAAANAPNTTMAAEMVSQAGGNQPHNNLMPYLTVNFCIAIQGVLPPRS
jgi:microcystin-dependent protein